MFKDTIKALRKEHGLTQTELGEVVGFTHVAVVKWENGQREPDFSTLIKLADYFGVSTDYLLGREEKKSGIERSTTAISSASMPAVFGDMPDLLSEQRFVNTAKIYHELPDELRERAFMLVYGIAVGLGLNVEKILRR